jgi:hypothetical protein
MIREPTEMELRVAEAIKSVDDSKPTGGLGASYLSLARAAIQAMREPTEKMIEAGFDEDGGRYITWIKMIYAASPQGE